MIRVCQSLEHLYATSNLLLTLTLYTAHRSTPNVYIGSWSPPSAPLVETAPGAAHLPPESAYYLAVNRNKRSVTVNFKTAEGLDIIRKLIAKSDVLVENFISGKLASMGLGWEDCQRINGRLIYASITG
jgi:succinate--hydroxymethylglutarate CoA-transferase